MNNLQTAIKSALQAGKSIMEIYESDDFGIETKADDSPLTKADKAAHEVIMEHLKETNIPVLSEEGKDISYEERKNWKQLWIVDPIDGTKEFIKRNGEFTVNIALVENQVPVSGVIYVPAKETLYYANKEKAFKLENVNDSNYEQIKNNKKQLPLYNNHRSEKRRLSSDFDRSLAEHRNCTEITVVASKSHLSPETQQFIDDLKTKYNEVKTISKGSSLKLCMVAEGTANYYPRFAPTMEWDTAAGQAICMAAGCDVIDQETQQTMVYNRSELLNNWFLVQHNSKL
ncbi:MAG: 3'(2'),5'-bisphosphate nucleotidase CysQ family protein [Bacteroidota bacterium]